MMKPEIIIFVVSGNGFATMLRIGKVDIFSRSVDSAWCVLSVVSCEDAVGVLEYDIDEDTEDVMGKVEGTRKKDKKIRHVIGRRVSYRHA